MIELHAGRVFLYWFGSTPNICVADYAMAKQLLAERTGIFAKNRSNANLLRLLGEGLVLANGDDWHRHKKVVHPAFNTDKLKVRRRTDAGAGSGRRRRTPWIIGTDTQLLLVIGSTCLSL